MPTKKREPKGSPELAKALKSLADMAVPPVRRPVAQPVKKPRSKK